MNNYIPINKAVNPVCIYQGNEPLISKTLGVDAMTFNFDGSACEHATCAGAPEMFIKVEEDGLYYFGVEADDTGSISIAGDVLCKKDGTKPNGKLNLATGIRYLKAGYYKVALSYTNNAYTPRQQQRCRVQCDDGQGTHSGREVRRQLDDETRILTVPQNQIVDD